jgi:hypothetical protein
MGFHGIVGEDGEEEEPTDQPLNKHTFWRYVDAELHRNPGYNAYK